MTSEIAEELGKYFLKMTNKKRNKNSGDNGDDDDDMNPNIKINIENILDSDLITPEYLEKLSKKFFKLANAIKSKDNADASESSGNNSESSGNNSGNNIDYYKKLVDKSKDLLEKIKKDDKDKKYISADELTKKLNARAEDDRKTNEILKNDYAEEAQRASKEVEKFNKMINDNLDMSSEKSQIINRLIELYSLK